MPCRFEENANGWKKVSFGPDFGGAIDEKGQLGCLKHGRDMVRGDEMGFGSETILWLRLRIFLLKWVHQLIFPDPQSPMTKISPPVQDFLQANLSCVMTR